MSKPNSLKKDLSLSNSLSPRNKSQKVKSPRSAPASLIDTGSTPIKVTIKGTAKEFYPPSKTSKLNPEAPENKLKLDWVYGYNGAQVNFAPHQLISSNKSWAYFFLLSLTCHTFMLWQIFQNFLWPYEKIDFKGYDNFQKVFRVMKVNVYMSGRG